MQHKRQIEEEARRVRELVADLPFHRMILQEIWERQLREIQSKRLPRRMKRSGGDMHFGR